MLRYFICENKSGIFKAYMELTVDTIYYVTVIRLFYVVCIRILKNRTNAILFCVM